MIIICWARAHEINVLLILQIYVVRTIRDWLVMNSSYSSPEKKRTKDMRRAV